MKVEKIHDNKISVFISTIDLKNRNIDIFEIYPQSSKIQSLFLDILEEAYLQQGFETEGSQLFVETKPFPNHGFHINITKFDEEDELEGDYSTGYIINELGDFFSQNTESTFHQELVFSFPSIDSIEPCVDILNQYSYDDSSLFQIEGRYVLALVLSEYSHDTFSLLTAVLSEHGIQEFFSIAYIDEHGKRVLFKDALENLNKYFKAGS